MANTIKSKLKRLGSKRRSDPDSSTDHTDSQTESIGSSKNSILGAPPAMQAPSAPRKSVDGSSSRESSKGSGTVLLKTPGGGPKSDNGAASAVATTIQTPAQAPLPPARAPYQFAQSVEPSAEKRLPVAEQGSRNERPQQPLASPAHAPKQVQVGRPPQKSETGPASESQRTQTTSTPPLNPQSSSPTSPKSSEANLTTADTGKRQQHTSRGTPDVDETPLEIKTVGNKQYVFKQNPGRVSPGNPPNLAIHRPVSARHSPMSSPMNSRSASPVPSPRVPKHTKFLIDSKHGQSHSVSGRPLSRSSSRIALQRTPSMAQIARDNKSHHSNDTRHFYQNSHSNTGGHSDARPSLSRKSSYADDKRAMEYISNKNSDTTAESSNLMFRTSSRIWDANKESDMWFNYESRSRISSRRESVASSDTDSEEDENLHPGRFISRSGSFASDEDEEAEFADSYIIRAADWLLGIPHDSPHTLRNTFKRKPKPMSLLDKRRLREANVATDPAFLLAAYMSLRDAML